VTAPDRLHPWTRFAARTGSTAIALGLPILLVNAALATSGGFDRLPPAVAFALGIVALPALALFAVGMAAAYLPRPLAVDPFPLRSPVRGRCSALNGPATKVPSHGMHLLGQTYAIDVVHEPGPGVRPSFGGRQAMRRPEAYPSFDQPVHAPADGVVARVYDGARDHRCRSNLLGYLYLLVEGVIRQTLGTRAMLGNHVVLTVADGTHVAIAHLRRGSVAVAPGARVVAGQELGRVGNSGNSSEPHIHLQRMDRVRPAVAAGLPFVFTDVVVDDGLEAPAGAPEPVIPEDQVAFHAGLEVDARS
jgi:hypothetical protein